MKAFEIQGGFGLENLRAVERPEPADPTAGQILIELSAVSLNYRDLMMVRGHYNPRQRLPLIPCSDAVGRVLAIGEGVTRVKVGDRLSPTFTQGWLAGRPTKELRARSLGGPLDGTLVERMCVDADSVVHVPAELSDEQAACLPCAGVTAWNALAGEGSVGAGDTVVSLGTGGVSIFVLQLAQALGAQVIITSSSDEKLARAKAMGAWQGINYRKTPEWGRKVVELTDGRGADHIIELGGAGTLEQSMIATRLGGSISIIGVLTGVASEINLIPILMGHLRLQGILVGHREHFEALNRALSDHGIRPVVDRVLPFSDAVRAFEYLASAAHFGKVCLRLGS